MLNLFLFGKEYADKLLFVDGYKIGETNNCNKILNRKGGIYNLFDKEIKNIRYEFFTSGLKTVYIVSDKEKSTRTSFVLQLRNSQISKENINNINKNHDWMHVCYLDDIECYKELNKINIPFSVDFCTDKKRYPYFDIINKAEIVFDSREKKSLYKEIFADTPIILHDEFGFEIIQNGKKIHEKSTTPIKGLNVNGAGDIYAAAFLEHYGDYGLFDSAEKAMEKATKILRKRNEKI